MNAEHAIAASIAFSRYHDARHPRKRLRQAFGSGREGCQRVHLPELTEQVGGTAGPSAVIPTKKLMNGLVKRIGAGPHGGDIGKSIDDCGSV